MNLVESIIDCKRCKGNACIQIEDKDSNYKIWIDIGGCGFTSSPGCTDENKSVVEETLPELYKALAFKDEENHYWYPSSINLADKGMVFADGTSTKDWKWSGVPVRKIKLNEKLKYPEGTKFVPNMKKLKQFNEKDFIEGLDYIGYFSK